MSTEASEGVMDQHAAGYESSMSDQFPREVGPGLFWMSGCLLYEYKDELWHNHYSCYLIVGTEKTVLVDTGHPAHWPAIERALDRARGGRTVDYVMPTHPEMPHAGNLPHLIEKFPDIQVIGDVRDYHLYFPGIEGNLTSLPLHTELDLGGRTFTILPAVWRDLPSTQWGYDSGARCTFVADGFGYSHHHLEGECALLSKELPEVPDPEQTRFVNERALYWTKHVDSQESIVRLTELFERHPSDLVAPAHGSVINNMEVILPVMYHGMNKQRGQEWTARMDGPAVSRSRWFGDQPPA